MGKYFTEETTKAIVEMQKTESTPLKNKIFVKQVMPAFDQLVNYWYGRFPNTFAKNPELKQDALTHLFESIDKFKPEEYISAFPYFNMVARNFYIGEMTKQNKEARFDFVPMYDLNNSDDEPIVDSVEEDVVFREFVSIFRKNLIKWRKFFKKEKEKKVVEGLITIFDNIDNLELYNKRAVFVYLREITNLNSKQISANIIKIKKKFIYLKQKYDSGNYNNEEE